MNSDLVSMDSSIAGLKGMMQQHSISCEYGLVQVHAPLLCDSFGVLGSSCSTITSVVKDSGSFPVLRNSSACIESNHYNPNDATIDVILQFSANA